MNKMIIGLCLSMLITVTPAMQPLSGQTVTSTIAEGFDSPLKKALAGAVGGVIVIALITVAIVKARQWQTNKTMLERIAKNQASMLRFEQTSYPTSIPAATDATFSQAVTILANNPVNQLIDALSDRISSDAQVLMKALFSEDPDPQATLSASLESIQKRYEQAGSGPVESTALTYTMMDSPARQQMLDSLMELQATVTAPKQKDAVASIITALQNPTATNLKTAAINLAQQLPTGAANVLKTLTGTHMAMATPDQAARFDTLITLVTAIRNEPIPTTGRRLLPAVDDYVAKYIALTPEQQTAVNREAKRAGDLILSEPTLQGLLKAIDIYTTTNQQSSPAGTPVEKPQPTIDQPKSPSSEEFEWDAGEKPHDVF